MTARIGAHRTGLLLRLLGVALLTLSTVTFAAGATSAAPAAASAVTVTGSPGFPGLAVTVSKTTALTNEVVQVSWKGAAPTRGNFGLNYLQIMQCWGSAIAGPEREQCQFGGLTGDSRGGAFVSSRQVTYDITDPAETLRPTKPGQLRFVPFRSVTGKTTEAGLSEFFDASTTNEVPYAKTRPDGGGVVPFEVQTSTEAPGLGCGLARTNEVPAVAATGTATVGMPSGAPGLRCFLVVVPRGDNEVDGSRRTADNSRQLLSSPLSQSNWAQRLVVPLDFTQVGQPCPLGRAERSLVGQEAVEEAVSSWQPALCEGQGPTYSFSQLSDTLARSQVIGAASGLSITSRPLAPDSVPAGQTPTYAPVALAGIAIAFNIDSQSAFRAPPEVKERDGQRVTELNLTPRLVAKLLTQSYRVAAAQPREGLEKNPNDLTRDPEFLRANPAFDQLAFTGIGSIVVPASLSDSAGLLWRWLLADPEAKAFLAGAPDPDKMVVNPVYKGTGQQDGFPKSDTVCTTFLTSQPPLCTLDAFPYAGDSHEAARAAARGDTLSRSNFDASATPPVYRRSVPQPTGSRSVLALADTATAERYGLSTARLRNASGAFVAPDQAGLLAGLAAMKPGQVREVMEPQPSTTDPAAYPLTSLSYAVALPQTLTPAARADYATFLRYAAGPGQLPDTGLGGLPPGYAPLPSSLRTQTLGAATRIATMPATAAIAPTPSPAGPATSGKPDGGVSVAAPPTDSSSPVDPLTVVSEPALGGSEPVVAGDALTPTPVTASSPPLAILNTSARTPAQDPGAARYGVVLILAVGGLAALAGSWLRRTSRPPLPG